MREKNPDSFGAITKDYLVMGAGAALYAISMVMFLQPAQIPVGGLTGIAMILNFLFGLPIGILIIIMNVPLFLLSYKFMGRRFVVRSAFAMALSSILIDIFELFLPAYRGDTLLTALYGGVLHGVGLGLIFSHGGTTGGSDIISKLINIKTGRTVGQMSLLINSVVIVAAAFVYAGDRGLNTAMEIVLYAILVTAAGSYIIDTILNGLDNSNAAFIITDNPVDVADAIFQKCNRGVTAIHAEGMFSKTPKTTLLCAVRSQEVLAIKRAVGAADPNAFMILTNAREVLGKGFKPYS